jgi:hypothetical protein
MKQKTKLIKPIFNQTNKTDNMKTYNLELIEERGFDILFGLRETPLTESDIKGELKQRFEVVSDRGNKQGDAVIYNDDFIGLFIGAGKEIRSPKTYRLKPLN